MARLQETGDWAGTWSAVRKLVGCKIRPARLCQCLVTTESLSRLFRRRPISISESLCKEFGENSADFSEAEHLVRRQAEKQAAQFRFTRSPTDTCALPGTEREWEDALHVLSKPKSGRALGPDAIPLELIVASGRATHAKQQERSFALQLSRKDVCQRAASSRGALAPDVSWYVADGSGPRRRYGICHHDAQAFPVPGLTLRKLSSAVIYVDIRKAIYSRSC